MWKRKRKPCLIDFFCSASISFTNKLGTDKILFHWFFFSWLGWWESTLVIYLKLHRLWDICIVHGILKCCLWTDTQAGIHIQTLIEMYKHVTLSLARPLKKCSYVMYNVFFIRHFVSYHRLKWARWFWTRTSKLLKLARDREIWCMFRLKFFYHQNVVFLSFFCVIAKSCLWWGKVGEKSFNLTEVPFIIF